MFNQARYPPINRFVPCEDGLAVADPNSPMQQFRCNNVSYMPVQRKLKLIKSPNRLISITLNLMPTSVLPVAKAPRLGDGHPMTVANSSPLDRLMALPLQKSQRKESWSTLAVFRHNRSLRNGARSVASRTLWLLAARLDTMASRFST
jgi:hypothetical protein